MSESKAQIQAYLVKMPIKLLLKFSEMITTEDDPEVREVLDHAIRLRGQAAAELIRRGARSLASRDYPTS